MKKNYWLCVIIILGMLVCKTAVTMTTPPKDEIPIPNLNFTGRIVDSDNIVTDGTHISIQGFTYLAGRIGSTDAYIPLERIKMLTIESNSDEKIQMKVEMTDGSSVDITGDGDDEITGEASFGQFRVRLKNIKTMQITGSTVTTPATKKIKNN